MIEAHLNKIELSEENCRDLRRLMSHTSQLVNELSKRQSLNEVLALLYAELSGANRPSCVKRIYSRYRAVSRARDMEAMQLWAKKNRK